MARLGLVALSLTTREARLNAAPSASSCLGLALNLFGGARWWVMGQILTIVSVFGEV